MQDYDFDIDIACIQGTHCDRNDHIDRNGYAIVCSGENKTEANKANKTIKAGAAVAVKAKWGDTTD